MAKQLVRAVGAGKPLGRRVGKLLPEGERWFVKVFSEALPLIKDDQLREDVLGFIGQEGMHAGAHQGVQDHFVSQGVDTSEHVADLEHPFRRLLGTRRLTVGERESRMAVCVSRATGRVTLDL